MATNKAPRKVRMYRVEWLDETFHCEKKSEIREWLKMCRTQYAGLLREDDLAEPQVIRVDMWRIEWDGAFEDFQSEYEAADALRDYERRAEIERNSGALEAMPDPLVGMHTPFLLYGAAMRRANLFGTVSPSSIQAAFDAGRLWCSRGRMNPMERDCWLAKPVAGELRLACIHGWLDRDFEYRHKFG